MPKVVLRPIIDRIAEGSIDTNFLIFPPAIGEFQRDPLMVADSTNRVYLQYAFYRKETQTGIVFLEDLWHGRRQVRAFEKKTMLGGLSSELAPSGEILYAE